MVSCPTWSKNLGRTLVQMHYLHSLAWLLCYEYYIVAILPLWLEFPLLVRASNSKGLVFSSPKSRTIISWLSLICVSTSLSITLAGSWTSRRLRRRPHDSKLSRPLVHETWNNNDKCACNFVCTKGQLISKWFFWYLQFFQKTNEKFDLTTLTTMVLQVKLFSFVFLKN